MSRAAQGQVRVASVPASHAYVRHLDSPDGADVARLPDPPAMGRGEAPAGAGWWPPRMLASAWIDEHHRELDVMHVHFGFDACSPGELRETVAALRRHDVPLVLTVHDLRNPHHRDRALHDAQLDVLVPAADAVLTLTAGAAREIEGRWGRGALVVPHPHVVDLETMSAERPEHEEWRVGLHVKSLRACMDPVAVLPTLAEAVRDVPGGMLQVDVHTDVAEPDGAHHDPALMSLLADLTDVDVRVHDYFSDEQLWDYLSGLDVSVLPYRFGTHSGWLEACRDLDTQVVVPTCGFYADQGPVHSFVLDEARFDADSLVHAVRDAWKDPHPAPGTESRLAQRHEVATVHRRVYEAVLGR